MPTDMLHTATRLRAWRLQRGLTMEEVADLTGFSQSFLSRLERGERNLPPLARVHFARALGCRVRDLFPPPHQEAAAE